MKKLVFALIVLVIATSVSSCRTSKYGCPAVASASSSKTVKA